jgi:hypothetical protein
MLNRREKKMEDAFYRLDNFIVYLEHHMNMYDKLVKKGDLPAHDKHFREALIQSHKSGELVDLICPDEMQDNKA